MKKPGELVIDPELVALIPPLTSGEFGTLTDNIQIDGILNPITIWVRPKNANTPEDCDLVIVDGHNRYKIAQELDIGFAISEMRFETIEHAKLWMCSTQLGRRNLTPETRRNLIGQQVSLRKQTRGKKGKKDKAAPSTAEVVGAEYSISPRSAKDAKVYADGIEVIRTVDSNLANEILLGKSSYTSADVMYAARLDKRTSSFVRGLLKVKSGNKHLSLEIAEKMFDMDLPANVIESCRRGASKAKINAVVTNLSFISASLSKEDTYVALAIDYYFAKDCLLPLETFFQMACVLPTFPSFAENVVVKNPALLEFFREKWFAFYDFIFQFSNMRKDGTNKSPVGFLKEAAFEMRHLNGLPVVADALMIATGEKVEFEDVTLDDMKQHLVYIQDCLASVYSEKEDKTTKPKNEKLVVHSEKEAKTTKPKNSYTSFHKHLDKESPYSPIPRNALDALLSVLEKTNHGFSQKLSKIVVDNANSGVKELESFIEEALSEEHVVVDELTENADLAEIDSHISALEKNIKLAEEELAKMRSLKERTNDLLRNKGR